MAMLADLLKEFLASQTKPPTGDYDMVRSPLETERSASENPEITPKQLDKQMQGKGDPNVIYDDQGNAVDYDFTGTAKKMLDSAPGGKGTLTGFLKAVLGDPNATPDKEGDASAKTADPLQGTIRGFLNKTLLADQPSMQFGAGTVGGGAGSDHVPGTGTDPALNPTPTAQQRQRKFASIDPNNRDLDGNPAGMSAKGKTKQGVVAPLEPGNINLSDRPQVQNADGTTSTVRTKTFEFDGKHILLPTVGEDGTDLSDQEAVQQFRQTGKHLGVYANSESASAYANVIHNQQASMLKYAQPSALDSQAIEELRQSLLTDSGQRDPNNPNGLAARMNSPYSKLDQEQQMGDAQRQSDELSKKQRSLNRKGRPQ